MRRVVKIFGLPRTGTNLLHHLMAVNFKEHIATAAEHGVDHLGWKHGLPLPIGSYDFLGKVLGEELSFVFTRRDFDSWRQAYETRHSGTWENPNRYRSKDKFVFVTPMGPQIYGSIREYYEKHMGAYEDFARANPSRSCLVDFHLLTDQQEDVVRYLQTTLNLEPSQPKPCTISKRIGSTGLWLDTI